MLDKPDHWSRLKTKWLGRTQIAADWLKGQPAVADIGCGLMALRDLLPADTDYVGVDVTPRDDKTVVIDLNGAPLPDLGPQAAAALGLFEYIVHPGPLLERMRQFETLVVSYNHFSLGDMYWAMRRKPRPVTWVNRYTKGQFLALVRNAGFRIEAQRRVQLGESIYLLRRAPV